MRPSHSTWHSGTEVSIPIHFGGINFHFHTVVRTYSMAALIILDARFPLHTLPCGGYSRIQCEVKRKRLNCYVKTLSTVYYRNLITRWNNFNCMVPYKSINKKSSQVTKQSYYKMNLFQYYNNIYFTKAISTIKINTHKVIIKFCILFLFSISRILKLGLRQKRYT